MPNFDVMKLRGRVALVAESAQDVSAFATVAFVEKFEDVRICVDDSGSAPLTWKIVPVDGNADFVLRVVDDPFAADVRVRFLAHTQGSASQPCCRDENLRAEKRARGVY